MSDSPAPAPAEQTPDVDSLTRDIAEVPAVELITTVAVHLMSAAAVNLGLAEEGPQHRDLDEARKLIQALAGLVTASATEISSFHAGPLRTASSPSSWPSVRRHWCRTSRARAPARSSPGPSSAEVRGGPGGIARRGSTAARSGRAAQRYGGPAA